eukprot:13203896-Alexandrium_andersonii.AAC.1
MHNLASRSSNCLRSVPPTEHILRMSVSQGPSSKGSGRDDRCNNIGATAQNTGEDRWKLFPA